MLEVAVKAGDSKRAEDIVALDMRGVSLLADYFVIMSGTSDRQVQAVSMKLRIKKKKPALRFVALKAKRIEMDAD